MVVSSTVRDNDGIRVQEAASCPLCGGSGRIRYDRLRDRSWNVSGIWSFRECNECGHLWLDPRPIGEDIGRLYASYYTHGVERGSPLQGNGFWPMCRRGVLEAYGYLGVARSSTERLLGRAMHFVPPVWDECEEIVRSVPGPPRGRLLDVGCGDGYFLRVMQELGWTVQGLEPDPRAAGFARAHGLEILEMPIERAPLDRNGFDAITMSHVIEHVPDPVAVLSDARRALKPGGILLVSTPNANSWGHSMFGPSWYPLEPPRHFHIFRPENLAACAERAHLQVVDLRTTGRLHLIFDASVSIRKTGRYGFDDPTIQASLFDQLFRATENLLVRVRRSAGEEIVMRSTKIVPD
jgi:2-polyprenyl-3-methyl-5-hydroxy-6-metoxy-1,4-benzoquinol methylase